MSTDQSRSSRAGCSRRSSASRTATRSRCRCSAICTGCSPSASRSAIPTSSRRWSGSSSTMSRRRCIAGRSRCAHIAGTTEDQLAEALMISDASELFAGLRSLSFIESGPTGVFPHDLTREVIESDLRWRSPERFRQLHDDVRRGIVRRLRHGSLAAAAIGLLGPDLPASRQPDHAAALSVGSAGSGRREARRPRDDHDLLIDIVRRQQGSASAAMVKYWMQRQPDGFSVFRDAAGGEIIGFACMLEIAAATEEDCRRHRRWPLRPDTQATSARLGRRSRWCTAAGMPSRSTPVPSDTPGLWEAICMINVIRWVETPRLSWSFVATDNHDRWAPSSAISARCRPAGRVQRRRPWLRGLRS